MSDKVAVVTGSNKGIGFGIVKELCKRGVGVVYLTSRDAKRGKHAVKELKKEGFSCLFFQLDVADISAIQALAEHLKKEHGGLDILINNAGVANSDFFKTSYEDAKWVIDINYRTHLEIQKHLFPILNDNARVINISSDCGHISNLKNSYWIKELTKDNLTVQDIDTFVDWFLEAVKNGTLNQEDFAETTVLGYRISKVALCALTRVQQKLVGRGISVNSMHPGLVSTDMTANIGDWSIQEASATPVYLALDVDQSVKGKYFWFDKTEKEWSDPTLNLYFQVKNLEIAASRQQKESS